MAHVLIYEQDIWWTRFRNFLLHLEEVGPFMGLLPMGVRKHFRGREAVFVFFMTGFVIVCASLLAPRPWWWLPVIALLAWRTIEIVLILLSVAFVSRGQRDPLRSLVLWLLNYFQVVVAFGCFFWMLPPHFFSRRLNTVWDGIYLSAVTSVTLGDAAISPVGRWSKILLAIEPALGLLFVAAILSVLLGRLQEIPVPARALNPKQLADASAERGKPVNEKPPDPAS